MTRVYTRKFDYEEARRLFREGALVEALAVKFGVSTSRVWQVVTPGEEARRVAYRKAHQAGVCEGCGGLVNRYSLKKAWRRRLCRACSAKAISEAYWASRVRERELLCSRCGVWKPDGEFPGRGPVARRGRKSVCRACATEARRDYRRRFPERERESSRLAKARRRESSTHV